MAEKITDNVFWIGVNNPDGRDFHGIHTPRGGSYNSYLVKGSELALIDGTNKPFFKEYLESLKSVCSPAEIKYIIINHAEPDHTGALLDILNLCLDAKIICTKKGEEFLRAAYRIEREYITVSHEQEVSIGNMNLRFYLDPMVHWPETMMTYLVEEKMLFSADMFGTEIAHESLFSDEMESFEKITRDYATLVIRPMAGAAKKAILFARELNPSFLCPSHGPIYRSEKNIQRVVEYYDTICNNPEEYKVTIIYFSIWHGTEKIAKRIETRLREQGANATSFNLAHENMVSLMAEILTSKIIALGSLSILGSYHPLFEALFPFIQLNCMKKKTFVFGTHGWCSCAVPKLKKKLTDSGHTVISELDIRFGPKSDEEYEEIDIFADKIKKALEE
jgi:flavorubredoxin